jgi:hypothetical protein
MFSLERGVLLLLEQVYHVGTKSLNVDFEPVLKTCGILQILVVLTVRNGSFSFWRSILMSRKAFPPILYFS